MKYLPLLLLILLSPRESIHYAYLPIITQPDCRQHRGIAWQSGGVTTSDRLGACSYYHAHSHNAMADGYAVPIIRPDFAVPDAAVIAALTPAYNGDLLILNEPEIAGQDNITPAAAAEWVLWVRGRLPHARLVGANVLAGEAGYDWLSQYLDVGGLPFDVWGVHIYRESECSPTDCINQLCEIVTCDGGNIQVTEIGYDNTLPNCASFGDWLAALDNDSRVSRVYGYTAVGGVGGGRLDFLRYDYPTCTGWQWIK